VAVLRRAVYIAARALLGVAFVLGVAALVAAGLGLYLATLPVRLAARNGEQRARSRTLQELLFALAAFASVRRRASG
jgi:hypothetical protein